MFKYTLPVLGVNLGFSTSIAYSVLASIIFLLFSVLAIAIYTLFERKLLGSGQRRFGPHVVGYLGILQPFADALKLLIKQFIIPNKSVPFYFLAAPAVVLITSLTNWVFMPISSYDALVFAELNLLFILGFSSIGAMGVLLTGWSGGSRYSLLGGLRAAAQLISYEIVFGFLFFPISLEAGSANLLTFMAAQSHQWFIFVYPILFILFLVLILAETNRAPFDLPEAESELVAGFNVEYASAGFTILFLAEYSSMMLMSALGAVSFLGGFNNTNSGFGFAFKVICFCFFIVAIRGVLPRYRYDQLMRICWGHFLSIVTAAVIIYGIRSQYYPTAVAQIGLIHKQPKYAPMEFITLKMSPQDYTNRVIWRLISETLPGPRHWSNFDKAVAETAIRRSSFIFARNLTNALNMVIHARFVNLVIPSVNAIELGTAYNRLVDWFPYEYPSNMQICDEVSELEYFLIQLYFIIENSATTKGLVGLPWYTLQMYCFEAHPWFMTTFLMFLLDTSHHFWGMWPDEDIEFIDYWTVWFHQNCESYDD